MEADNLQLAQSQLCLGTEQLWHGEGLHTAVKQRCLEPSWDEEPAEPEWVSAAASSSAEMSEQSEGAGCTSRGSCSQHSSSLGQEMARTQGTGLITSLCPCSQRRGCEEKCVTMVPVPRRAWGGRGHLQSARLWSSVAVRAGEQQCREHWPGPSSPHQQKSIPSV